MNSADEVIHLLEEGVDKDRLDKIMTKFGFPMPPFVLADEVGNDVLYKVSKVLEEAYGARMKTPNLLEQLYDKKLLGKKVGKGFYLWKGKHKTFNPEVESLLGPNAGKNNLPDNDIRDRIVLLLINEAARCLEEGIAKRPDYLDMALIMGTGFPPFRGGLLRYADTRGSKEIVSRLQELEKTVDPRFAPCKLLVEMAKTNKGFY